MLGHSRPIFLRNAFVAQFNQALEPNSHVLMHVAYHLIVCMPDLRLGFRKTTTILKFPKTYHFLGYLSQETTMLHC